MKKIFFLVVCMMSVFSLFGCQKGENDSQKQAVLPSYEIDGKTVLEKMEHEEKILILDVREDFELVKTGVLKNTIHIPLGSLSANSLEKMNISKSDEIVTFCRTGNRSYGAYKTLKSLGFENVKSLAGGIVDWVAEAKSVEEWGSSKKNSLVCFNSVDERGCRF